MAVNWGFTIKELRKNRGMEQIELAQRSGLTQSHISRIESGAYSVMTPEVEKKLARGFCVSVQVLRSVVYGDLEPPTATTEELIEQLRIAVPVRINVYSKYPYMEGVEMLDVDIYKPRPVAATVEAYQVPADYPNEIKDGDIIVIDNALPVSPGKFVSSIINDDFVIGWVVSENNTLYIDSQGERYPLETAKHVKRITEIIRRY